MSKSASAANLPHRGKYRADIDGVRAVAVSSVVVGHAFPDLLPGGFVGVDIFFVISGYLISSILIGEIEDGSFSLGSFYGRRIRRIFPALIVVLAFIVIAGWICLFKQEFAVLGRHVVASAMFSENFALWSEAGYFDVASETKPTLHLWSLAIEEQFYIVWPILLYLAYRMRMKLAAVIALFAGGSFLLNLHDVHSDPTAAYYSPVGRGWELMIGCGLAYVRAKFPQALSRHINLQSVLGSALIGGALAFVTPDRAFPGFWALLPTLGTSLLISSGENAWINRRLLAAAPMVGCGLISYPLYLWHWPLLSFAHVLFGPIAWEGAIAIVGISVAAATLTFWFVERPFRRPEATGTNGVLLLRNMIAVLGCGGLMMAQLLPSRLDAFDAPTKTEWDFLKRGTQDFDRNGIGIYALDPERSNQALFIGDSRIAQYAARLDKIMAADPDRPGAVLAIGGGCVPIEGVTSGDVKRAKCWPQRDTAYEMAEQARFRTIVVGGAWNWYFLRGDYTYESGGRALPLTSPEGRQAALARLGRRIEAWTQSGKRVVFVLDNPVVRNVAFSGWKVRLALTAASFRPDRTVEMDPAQLQLKDELAIWATSAGATVIDPFDAICAGKVCRVTTDTGQFMFKDQGHFNPDWTIAHADFIDEALRK